MNVVPGGAILLVCALQAFLILDVSAISCYECSYGELFSGANAKDNEACLKGSSSSLPAVKCHPSHRSCVKISAHGDRIGKIMLRQCSNAYPEATCLDLGSQTVNSVIEGLPSVTNVTLTSTRLCTCSGDKCNSSPGWSASTNRGRSIKQLRPTAAHLIFKYILPFLATLSFC